MAQHSGASRYFSMVNIKYDSNGGISLLARCVRRLGIADFYVPILSIVLMGTIVFTTNPSAYAQEVPPLPYVVVGGFASVLAEPDLTAEVLGHPSRSEFTVTGISADGSFYRIDFQNEEGWIHQGDIIQIVGDLSTVPVVEFTPEQIAMPVDPSSVLTLESYDQGWAGLITELQNAGVIPKGGKLVFEEDYAFLAGRGDFFISLGRQYPETDIIMAGELTYNVGIKTEYENCGFLSRVVTDRRGDVVQFLEVGLDNEQNMIFFDRFGLADVQSNFGYVETAIDLDIPHHFLILALDNRLTVYLDGEMVIDNFEIVERSGIYGIGLMGRGQESRCEGRNIWVYQVPYAQPGVCEIRVEQLVNIRRGPGTNYDRVGRLTPGTNLQARSVTVGQDGFIWWQLDSGNWVRNDVVEAYGDCQNLPRPGESAEI